MAIISVNMVMGITAIYFYHRSDYKIIVCTNTIIKLFLKTEKKMYQELLQIAFSFK